MLCCLFAVSQTDSQINSLYLLYDVHASERQNGRRNMVERIIPLASSLSKVIAPAVTLVLAPFNIQDRNATWLPWQYFFDPEVRQEFLGRCFSACHYVHDRYCVMASSEMGEAALFVVLMKSHITARLGGVKGIFAMPYFYGMEQNQSWTRCSVCF
jgi:hypothetical protein